MKIVALHNLGCKVNAYEMEVMEKELVENGFRVVPFDQKADIYIINTCSVTNIADRKSRQMLHRAKALNPDAVIVAAGCYVNTRGAEDVLADSVDLAVINEDKKSIVTILNRYLAEHQQSAVSSECSCLTAADGQPHLHTRAYLKIQDGCNQFCSYCIIPYARGRIKSRTAADIHSEVEALASDGFREFVLTGIHLSSYGLDRPDDGENLISLIENISSEDGVRRIRLGSLEPRIITDEFASRLSAVPAVCPQFHLSLQSGCDNVLKRMNRHYTADEYFAAVELLRHYFSRPAITTDIITGFPGETETEFNETVSFVQRVNFYETHIFKYSRRAGTAADRMDGQLTDAVKAARSDVLINISSSHQQEFADSFIDGPEVELLTEEPVVINGNDYIAGYTKEYIRAAVPAGEAVPGSILKGRITGRLDKNIMAFSMHL